MAKKSKSKANGAAAVVIPRGQPKSGRFWKTPKTKFSSIKKVKGLHTSFAEKKRMRIEVKAIRDSKKAALVAIKEEKEMRKQRQEENKKRREENKRKAEIVQKISAAKVKKLKRKQLRDIRKR